MKKQIFVILVGVVLATTAPGQTFVEPKSIKDKMQWFADAKLGIFIHSGIYSVNGIDESWSFFNKKISYTDYMKQLKGFTMKNYDPAAWAELIKESGARYSVITTKHHDGVALYPTKFSTLNVVSQTPAKRDLIAPFFAELRKRGIKAGAYFSLLDWSHPDYPAFIKDSTRYAIPSDYTRWNRFRAFAQGQLMEVAKTY
ncbi:MAG: alpha-L-fucosidase, partial [Cyclobacteriaceae bacterium]|nr:alpha-L-fucosidase [Cyclobacteriaceae bacterium]